MDNDGRRRRTDNGACLYYKLTNEPKASGELKNLSLSGQSKHPAFPRPLHQVGLDRGGVDVNHNNFNFFHLISGFPLDKWSQKPKTGILKQVYIVPKYFVSTVMQMFQYFEKIYMDKHKI